jgi:tetratricopeptide (TPR) repeat protein
VAITDYNEVIRLDPKYAFAYYNRGNVYEAKKDYDHAIADFGDAIQLDSKNAAYFNSRCWVRALSGRDLTRALADCNESLRLRPDVANVFNSRGLAQLKLGAFNESIADYDTVVKQNAKDADSLYGRGIAKLRSGDSAGGYADISAAKAIRADITDVYAGYGIK